MGKWNRRKKGGTKVQHPFYQIHSSNFSGNCIRPSASTLINTLQKRRGRVEVESTIRPAKGRIAGFEGREGHRTPFAPVACKANRVQTLLNHRKFRHFDLLCWWYRGAIDRNPAHRFIQVGNRQVRVTAAHGQPVVAQESAMLWRGVPVCRNIDA
jgi:hypothetical protein